MRTRLIVKKPWNLTPVEYRKCLSLTLRSEGNMYKDIKNGRRKGNKQYTVLDAYVIMIIREEDGLLLGHAYIDRIQYKRSKNIMHPFAEFYVRKAYRRKGIGTRLIKKINHICEENDWPQFTIQPWDDRSEGFFNDTATVAPLARR